MATVGTFNVVNAADLSAVPSGLYSVDPTHAYINFQYNHLGLSNPTLGFDDFTMSQGDLFVVGKGVEHRVYSKDECHLMLVESKKSKLICN